MPVVLFRFRAHVEGARAREKPAVRAVGATRPRNASVPRLAILLAVSGALVLPNAVAFLPGRVAARTRPAVVLRAE